MISIDEAKEVYFKYVGEFSKEERVELMYDAINGSIGSCGVCNHYTQQGQCEKLLYFTNGGHTNNYMEVEEDFYCADFERKET